VNKFDNKNEEVMSKILLYLLLLGCCLVVGACMFVNQPQFGQQSAESSLDAIASSSHYYDGEFHNLTPTSVLSDDSSTFSILMSNLFSSAGRLRPETPVPTIKTELKKLDQNTDQVIWFGHSSCFVQLGGKAILIDLVFSDYASPLPFTNTAFEGTNIYTADDMPDIDYLLITHDHWDHLDYSTVMALKSKVNHVICPLGVGAHFEKWGYAREKIHETDWYNRMELTEELIIHVLPARHYSGRLTSKNQTLWAGFALETGKRRLFFSGDSGYGSHFAEIGRKFSGFDLAFLDCGQYDKRWPKIHMNPEEAVMAAEDLQAKALLPAHVGKFTIARHPWDEPFIRIAEASRKENVRLLTPRIGEQSFLDNM
jgi:L-ascorbate metabolism protein UlaG (beta-lactamase superfamily)